jgi:hypothetical protein
MKGFFYLYLGNLLRTRCLVFALENCRSFAVADVVRLDDADDVVVVVVDGEVVDAIVFQSLAKS